MIRLFLLLFPLLTIGCAISNYEIQPDPIYRETEIRHFRPRLEGEVFDSKESDPAYKEIFATTDKSAERAVSNVQRKSDFVLRFWAEKQRILKMEYGIDWKTPSELNPNLKYSSYGQPEITEFENRTLRSLILPMLSQGTEKINGISRSFEGVASVWTSDEQTTQIWEYRFSGYDESWCFIEKREWSE